MFKSVTTPKKSDAIVLQLENMIVEGSLKPGQKLPAERALAEQFSVSRPTIREAIQKLAATGVLESRQGGGTYVTKDLSRGFSDPLLKLLASHPEAQYDLLEFRHALDGLCAYYAALRSTAVDREHIASRHIVLQGCYAKQDYKAAAIADVEFHLAIAEASHNMVLLHMMRALFELVRQHIQETLQDVSPQSQLMNNIQDQHQDIMAAIVAGEPQAAQAASHAHFAYVEEVLLEQSKEHSRLERSLRRIDMIKQK